MDGSTTRDLHLYESGSGGELAFLKGDLVLTETLYQSIYISLFGGNIEASTIGNEILGQERLDFWGNSLVFANSPDKQFNSQTEKVLSETALNSRGRLTIQRAVESDLSFLNNIAKFAVEIFILDSNKVRVDIKMKTIPNQEENIYRFIWDNARNEVIINRTI
jgi:hypothetical protein